MGTFQIPASYVRNYPQRVGLGLAGVNHPWIFPQPSKFQKNWGEDRNQNARLEKPNGAVGATCFRVESHHENRHLEKFYVGCSMSHSDGRSSCCSYICSARIDWTNCIFPFPSENKTTRKSLTCRKEHPGRVHLFTKLLVRSVHHLRARKPS